MASPARPGRVHGPSCNSAATIGRAGHPGPDPRSSSNWRNEMPIPPPPPAGEAALRPDTFGGTGVIVTGGGTGLGRAIAVEFARLGADVAILSRKAEHLETGLAALKEF